MTPAQDDELARLLGKLNLHRGDPALEKIIAMYVDARCVELLLIRLRKDIRTAELEAGAAAEDEFYQEVRAALIAEGKAPHVAADLIDTPQKLDKQAQRLGL